MLKGIKNIIFDIGGVLVDIDVERCLKSFRDIGFDNADKFVSCYHPKEFFGALERGEITGADFCDEIRALAGKELLNEDIYRAYQSLLIGIPIEKLRLLRSLRERGYRLFTLSNMSEVMIPPILEFFRADALSSDQYFEKMYLSYQMGVMKPDPKIYEMVIEQSGILPSETLFIDDSEKNLAGGRDIGMQVYLAMQREDFSHLLV